MNQHHRIYRHLAVFILATVLAGLLLTLYLSRSAQWDFKAYYTAAAAHKLGLNPHEPAVLTGVAGEPITLWFSYPPFLLYVFHPFTWLGLPAAMAVYLTVKAAAVCALVLLWPRIFGLGRHMILFVVFIPFAFEGALLGDLRAGNISVFEQLFYLGGVLLLRQRKRRLVNWRFISPSPPSLSAFLSRPSGGPGRSTARTGNCG